MTRLYTWPGHDEALDGPEKPSTALQAFTIASNAGDPNEAFPLILAIFKALTESQQERIVESLGWEKAEDPPRSPSQEHPEEPGRDEASHVAQWIELSRRARNAGMRVWLDGPEAFGIQAPEGGVWKRCHSLYELRAAISDYVAHERAQGREPKPLDAAQNDPGATITDLEARWGLLASAIVSAAERAGMPTENLSEPPTGAELLGLVRGIGEDLYQRMMQDMASGPAQTISFVESDGRERAIVWEPGDMSVGIQPGYAADDNFADQHAGMLFLLKDLAHQLAEMPSWASGFPRIRTMRERIVKKINEIDPKHYGGEAPRG